LKKITKLTRIVLLFVWNKSTWQTILKNGAILFMSYENLKLCFYFFGGLGLLLYGMHIMAEGLQKMAGSQMKRILSALTRNKLMAVLVGIFVTGFIHSSTAVSVMLVGFVNAGLMNLSQAFGVIMGAQTGTTVTSWMISSAEWLKGLELINLSTLAPICVGLGSCMILFSKKERIKQAGVIIIGFGILFMGINEIIDSCEPLSNSRKVKDIFKIMGKNPILGFLSGIFVSALLHSSAASMGILQSLASLGLVPWNSAVYIIMGDNIGTCVTAIISSIGTSRNAKATAYMHFLFNFIGSIIFGTTSMIFFTFHRNIGLRSIGLTQISIIHSVFNIATTIILYPLSEYVTKLALFLVGKEKERNKKNGLDIRILENPGFAIEVCLKEILNMGNMALKNLKLAKISLVDKKNYSQEILDREKEIDELDHEIRKYLVKICNTSGVDKKENKFLTSLFYVVTDIERIGDHCENMADIYKFKSENDLEFNEKSKNDLSKIFDMTIECVENTLNALENDDKNIAAKTIILEENIDILEEKLREENITVLSNNSCDPKTSVAFLDIITNLERVSDHALNISQVVLRYKKINNLDVLKKEYNF
jgi:phosphate:Na+ symporter